MANKNLTNAKRAKNDEFYTQYGDNGKDLRLKDGTCPYFRVLIRQKKK